MKNIFTIPVIIVILVFSVVIGTKLIEVNADKNNGFDLKKEYHVVQISAGDTLWSIASENIGQGYTDINSYINDIKSVNNISSDHIVEGDVLVVPVYVQVAE